MPSAPHRDCAAALVLLAGLAGCAYPRLSRRPPVTVSVAASAQTRLGAALSEQLARHPGQSGLHVLASGYDAFAARVGLIDRAERGRGRSHERYW